eukprot:jgi/Mesvir1/12034/Mv00324-RA.1
MARSAHRAAEISYTQCPQLPHLRAKSRSQAPFEEQDLSMSMSMEALLNQLAQDTSRNDGSPVSTSLNQLASKPGYVVRATTMHLASFRTNIQVGTKCLVFTLAVHSYSFDRIYLQAGRESMRSSGIRAHPLQPGKPEKSARPRSHEDAKAAPQLVDIPQFTQSVRSMGLPDTILHQILAAVLASVVAPAAPQRSAGWSSYDDDDFPPPDTYPAGFSNEMLAAAKNADPEVSRWLSTMFGIP